MADKILVADDSLTIQKVVAITLANEPWVLVEATDESELFGKLRGGNYKLVLFDFNLSESKSGYELAAEIKKLAPTVRSMAMLGTFDSVEESELASSGVDGKIVKPFDSQKFIAKCRELIESGDGSLSLEEEKSLDFSDETTTIDDSEGWVMDSPQPSSNDTEFDDDSSDTWDEETSPGLSIEDNALSSELEGWGVSVPDPIGASPVAAQEIPPVIAAESEKESDLKWEEDESIKEDEIEFQVETSTASKDSEDTVYPETDDLDYPDLEFGLDKPKSNMISLDQLSVEEDSDLPLTLEREPEPIREDLAKEIESELSPDDFWAADEEEEGETTPTIELSQVLDDDLDDSRESFVVGVGDPSAPVEPIKPSQKSSIQIETSHTSFNEDEIVEKIKASLAPMLEDIVRKYMDEKIEKVAWEIIPDVAENLIRKEIKELSQASRNS
ncbi:MAG: hypothetical protein CME71_09610 [Halobacteriovorax sp.]|nr:hypothetical protein [Halobacteriovorax sp.]